MQPTKNLLNIQKLILLLGDFHFNHFTQFLEENNAALLLQLCLLIRKNYLSLKQLTNSTNKYMALIMNNLN
jgi:hypothetical protein